jgi:hypothetical protein
LTLASAAFIDVRPVERDGRDAGVHGVQHGVGHQALSGSSRGRRTGVGLAAHGRAGVDEARRRREQPAGLDVEVRRRLGAREVGRQQRRWQCRVAEEELAPLVDEQRPGHERAPVGAVAVGDEQLRVVEEVQVGAGEALQIPRPADQRAGVTVVPGGEPLGPRALRREQLVDLGWARGDPSGVVEGP